jgi:hypothetical protein
LNLIISFIKIINKQNREIYFMSTLRVAGEISTRIKGELLLSNYNVDNIIDHLEGRVVLSLAGKRLLLDIPGALRLSAKVYSENRTEMLETITEFQKRVAAMPTREQYLEANPGQEGERMRILLKASEEPCELANLAELMDHLFFKIARAFKLAGIKDCPIERMPAITLPTFSLILRKEPASRNVAQVMVTALSCPKDAVIGFCTEPTWQDAPTVLTPNGTDWEGKVPLNKEFKFVLIKDGKVIAWEKSVNRIIKEAIATLFYQVSF